MVETVTKTSTDVPVMVTQFNPRNPNIGSLIKHNWNVIQNTEELTQVFRSKPIISYRRLPNLKDMLTISSITYPPAPMSLVPINQFIPFCTRLGKCTYCPQIRKLEQITSFHTKKPFNCQAPGTHPHPPPPPSPPKHKLTCEQSNVIHIIKCNLCDLHYTAETKRPIRNKMHEHYSSVQTFQPEKSTPVSGHFLQKKHSVRNMEFIILHWMKPKCLLKVQTPGIILYLAIPYLHPAGISIFVLGYALS